MHRMHFEPHVRKLSLHNQSNVEDATEDDQVVHQAAGIHQ